MIRFNKDLLKGKPIQRLDEFYFKQDVDTDEIVLTEFAEDKIAKAMKEFYGKQLKELSLKANDMTYLTRSKDTKLVKDEESSIKKSEIYAVEHGKLIDEVKEEFERQVEEYKNDKRNEDEFMPVEVIDSASYFDGEDYVSTGGNLYELKCNSIKEAAIGYNTASIFLKENPVDKANVPTKTQLVAKDRKAWSAKLEEIRQNILTQPKFSGMPKDIFNPVVMKAEPEYTYSINWRATQKEIEDPEMLEDAANAYIASLM